MKNLSVPLLVLLAVSWSQLISKTIITKPSYPGGTEAMMEFLDANISYPEEANKNRMEGKTLVAFIVNEDGSISNIKIQKSSWQILDDEAMRVVQLMPKWIPAQLEGKPKKEMVILPILFNLKLIKDRTRLVEKE
ncbi:MAG TPA: energy transducer TonB [Chitinophagales bacterium]|nr:energy transducer TonB [Chitinophagales bacterium]